MKTEKQKKAKIVHVYCWASGLIQISTKPTPPGALHICSGIASKVVHIISALARHAYDCKTLLVPGVPEAELMGTDPVEAVSNFRFMVERRLNK